MSESRGMPSFSSTRRASARSTLSPPRSRCSPTATRSNDDARRRRANLDQREVGRAAADVADQHALAVRELAIERAGVRRDPGVERGGWLFDQREVAVARRSRRFDRELARHLVERGRHREHDACPRSACRRVARCA